jgi:hypothetical protein
MVHAKGVVLIFEVLLESLLQQFLFSMIVYGKVGVVATRVGGVAS